MAEKAIEMKKNAYIAELFGSFDCNLHCLEEAFGVRISERAGSGSPELLVKGDEEDVAKASTAIEHLRDAIENGEELSEQKLLYTISSAREGNEEELLKMAGQDAICLTV